MKQKIKSSGTYVRHITFTYLATISNLQLHNNYFVICIFCNYYFTIIKFRSALADQQGCGHVSGTEEKFIIHFLVYFEIKASS